MQSISALVQAETMRIFRAQNQLDAVTRQYRRYRAALNDIEAEPDTDEIKNLHKALLNN